MPSGLNPYANLDYLEASSAEDLKKMIVSIDLPVEVLAIYAVASRHYAWIRVLGRIRKVKKEKDNGKLI